MLAPRDVRWFRSAHARMSMQARKPGRPRRWGFASGQLLAIVLLVDGVSGSLAARELSTDRFAHVFGEHQLVRVTISAGAQSRWNCAMPTVTRWLVARHRWPPATWTSVCSSPATTKRRQVRRFCRWS